jgi:hypothetical protein
MKHCEFINFKNLMNGKLTDNISVEDKFYTITPKGSSGVEVEMSEEVYLLFGYGE